MAGGFCSPPSAVTRPSRGHDRAEARHVGLVDGWRRWPAVRRARLRTPRRPAGAPRLPGTALEERRVLGHRRRAEQGHDEDRLTQRDLHLVDEARRLQRRAAELEEAVVDADRVEVEDAAATSRPRGARGPCAAPRRARRAAGDGAPGPAAPCGRPCRWGSAGSARAGRRRSGTMYSGRRAAEAAAQVARCGSASPAACDDVGHQLAGPRRALLARRRRPRARPSMRLEGGLDLAQLDAEAADLDLEVAAAQELDVAVGQVARQVAGPVEAGRRAPGTGRRRSARRVSSGRSR